MPHVISLARIAKHDSTLTNPRIFFFSPSEKPHFKRRMNLETLGEFGSEIELPCDIGGVPAPNVTWFRDATPLSDIPGKSVRYTILANNSLHISFMRREDSGMFQCSATNEAGYVTGYTWLRVKSKSSILLIYGPGPDYD